MAYNESFNIPLWIKYYTSQVGERNVVIIDNDSTDDSAPIIRSVPNIRYPRKKFSDFERSEFVSQFANSLLKIYDYVIYADADEIIVADPTKYTSLVDFIKRNPADAHTCIGFNLYERLGLDDKYDSSKSLFSQRNSLNLTTSMCKTSVISKPVSWSGGFHAANIPPNFSGLQLIQIKSSVNRSAKDRLIITRNIEWKTPGKAGGHQRISDERFDEISASRSKRPLVDMTADLLEEITTELNSGVKPINRGRGDILYHIAPPSQQWYVTLPESYVDLV